MTTAHTGECFPGEDETYVRPSTTDEAAEFEAAAADRAARIAAYRELLDVLEANPSLPLPHEMTVGRVSLYGFNNRVDYTFAARDFIAAVTENIAIVPGTMAKVDPSEDDRPQLSLRTQFGPITVEFVSDGIEADRL